ncbi:MAG: tRNA (cytidine(34)-2'-O)-methyltransferase [Cyanobacteria bacterium P01_A01_bin.123]
MPRVVLVYPQIPPNTGNIARTCAATGVELHLVEPLGFELSDRHLKRAGLDYWPNVDLHVHPDWDSFLDYQCQQGGRLLGFSTSGRCSYVEMLFADNDWLLFGSETQGLPREILDHCQQTLYIPMRQPQVRSLNLSVSVSIGLFEALRQVGQLSI